MYCAIIGDIIDSREIEQGRSETQERFKNALIKINDKYKNDIESNFSITAGDGFYGLLNSTKNLFNIILEIRLAIIPNQIRMGIGIGDISTKIVKDESNLVDGRANSTAREAIDYISGEKNKYQSVYRTTYLKVDSRKYEVLSASRYEKVKTYEDFINAILSACSAIEKKWDSIHAETIELKSKKYTQREMADILGIKQPSVQGRLTSADYYLYEYYKETIESGIEKLWEEVNDV